MEHTSSNRTQLWKQLDELAGRPALSFGLLGAVLGYHYGGAHLDQLFRNPEHFHYLTQSLGADGLTTLRNVIFPVSGSIVGGCVAEAVRNVIKRQAVSQKNLVAERTAQEGFLYKLPPWPTPEERGLALILGENHDNLEGGYSETPTWSKIPAGGLWGNIAIFGVIGTGKSTSTARPFTRQLFEYRPSDSYLKIGGLVLSEKGDEVADIEKLAHEFGREKDILKIRPGGNHKWNPIHSPKDDPEVIAGRLVAVHENLSGGTGQEGQWVVDGVLKVFMHSIGLLRISRGYVTLKDVHEFLQTMMFSDKEAGLAQIVTAINELNKDVHVRFATGEVSEEDLENAEFHSRFWLTEWAHGDSENTSTIADAATNITTPFAKPSNSKTFCAPENELNFPGFEATIDQGIIVCLDAPGSEYGVMTQTLGIMLKLAFQRAALSRVARSKRDPAVNKKRPLLFLSDEYQNFVTTTSARSRDGDDKFFSESRQSRCVSIVLTQTPSSLPAKFGKSDDKKSKVLMSSLRTKIFLTLLEKEDQEWAADLIGKIWKDIENKSFQESVDGSGYDPITDSMTGKKSTVSENITYNKQLVHIVEPTELSRLKAFEGIVFRFDGVKQNEPERIYMKADFIAPHFEAMGYTKYSLPYKLFIEWFETIQEED